MTDPPSALAGWPLADEIGSAIWRAQRAVERAADARLASAGLPTSVFRVLRLLDREPGQSAADLARHLGFAAQSVAFVIERAERDGYVRRRPHPVHGRIRQLFLTESGRAALERGTSLVRTLESDLAGHMDPAARGLLWRQLLAIALRAEEIARSATSLAPR